MSNDDTIQVKFGAQIQGLLDGMGKAQEAVKIATEGMSSNIARMAETFETMGVAALGLAAVGLAFEGIKKSIEYVNESIEGTKELAEQFKTLGYATGASIQEMNQYTAAIELSGGSTENLKSLLVGMQRGIKANSDALIANGVAADKAALNGLSFEEYLKRVHEIAEKMATPTEREQFLIMALGRGGAMAGAMLGEFVENLEKTKNATIITPLAMAQLEETKQSIGRLKIAQQEYAASVSASATPIANFFRDLHTWYVEGLNDSNKAMEAYQKMRSLISGPDAVREAQHAKGMSGSVEGPASQHLKTAPTAPAAVKSPMQGWEAELAKMKADLITANGDQAELGSSAERAFWAAKVAKAKEGTQEWIAATMKMAEAGRKTDSELTAADKLWEARKDAILKEQADADTAYWKANVERENGAYEVGQKLLKRREEEQKKALEKEKMMWDGFFSAVSSGFQASITGLIKGTMSWGEAFRNVISQALDGVINFFVQWGIQEAIKWATGLAMGATSREAEASGAAAVYAVNAASSVAAIPVYGWAMAEGVGAAAYAQGLGWAALAAGVSSAAGGWDRVPADQMAMIHKNEMVLPATLAEGARKVFSDGGGGSGSSTVINIHANDAKSFVDMLKRNQGGLMSVLGSASRNGRRS